MPINDYTITLDEGQRQAVLLALGHLAADRPGWEYMLSEIALKIDNEIVINSSKGVRRAPELFTNFRRMKLLETRGRDDSQPVRRIRRS